MARRDDTAVDELKKIAAIVQQYNATGQCLRQFSTHEFTGEVATDWRKVVFEFQELSNVMADTWGGQGVMRPKPATAGSAEKARQVFAIPELLEQIALSMHPIYVLDFMQTDRGAYDIISNSSAVQRHMNLLPDQNSFFRSFFNISEVGFICDIRPRAPIPASGSLARHAKAINLDLFTVGAAFLPMPPRLGKRVRSMLICQPPIKEMHVKVTCCSKPGQSLAQSLHPGKLEAPQPILSATGITVDDLYDATRELVKAHRLCPWAELHEHDDDGYVRVNPRFQAKIQLRDDDPLLIAHRKRTRERKEEVQRSTTKHASLSRYSMAKQSGRYLLSVTTFTCISNMSQRATPASPSLRLRSLKC